MGRFLILCLILSVCARGAEPSVTVLDNGLTVILQEMHYAPTVAVVVVYDVGSRNETEDIAGISHFLEHMMFNGTPSMPGQRFWQIVHRNGGYANAGTGYDMTSYFLYMPASALEEALAIESDRMANLLLDPYEVAQEIGVVTDEWRLSQDSPFTALLNAADSVYYGDTPYSMKPIGTCEAIAAFDSVKVSNYYRTWYSPCNAVLAVVGDFDSAEALEAVERLFGPIPAGNTPDVEFEEAPPLTGRSEVTVEFPAEADRALIYFDGCSYSDPDYPALVAIADYFSNGRNAWFQENLIATGLATEAWAWPPYNTGRSPFVIYLQPAPGVSLDTLEEIVLDEAFRLTREPLDPDRLDVITGYYAGSQVMSEDNPLSVAMQLAFSMTESGDPLAHVRLRDSVMALTPEQVMDVASRHFSPDRMVAAVLRAQPGGSGSGTSFEGVTDDIEVPQVTDWEGLDLDPAGLVAPERSVSEGTVRYELDNGLTLLVKEDHSFPIIEIMATVPMGDCRTDDGNSGISALVAETMQWGANGMSQSEFSSRLMRTGGGIWLSPTTEFTLGNCFGPSEHTALYFESLADMLIRPNLLEPDFEQVRDLMVDKYRLMREDPMSLASSRFGSVLFEEGSRWQADTAKVAGIDYQEMTAWYGLCVRPGGSVIAVVGDITPGEALGFVEEYFGEWSDPDEPLPPARQLVFRSGPGETLVETLEGRIEAGVVFGCEAPAYGSPDYQAFRMMTSILGGGISSRMGMNLRERQGLTYSVGAYVQSAINASPTAFIAVFMTGAPFASRALEAAQQECALMAAEGVQPEELILRQYMNVGQHSMGFDTYKEVVRYLATRESLGLPLDSDLSNLREILSLDADDIKDVAARYFTGEWFVSAAGGIDENLQPLE